MVKQLRQLDRLNRLGRLNRLDWLDRLEWLKRLKSLNLFKYMVILLAIIVTSCDYLPEKPELQDGSFSFSIIAKYYDINNDTTLFIDSASVILRTNDYELSEIEKYTNDFGYVEFNNMLTTVYDVKLKGTYQQTHYNNPDSLVYITVLGYTTIIPGFSSIIDTINTISFGTSPGLKINEIYMVGPPNNFFYCYDQYIELYNSSDETKYLDGMIFCRMSYSINKEPIYIFQFPGKPLIGREYPVESGEFVILAQDAINHITLEGESVQLPGSIDLSNADWEFKDSRDFGDWDNPNVPNIDNIMVKKIGEFMINLISDVVLLGDGSDVDYLDGIDVESIVDCVEYSSNPNHRKDIEVSVDQGFCGIGLAKYSSMSLERIEPGFDTNNSTYDFEIIDAPTLWYHHE